MGFDRQCKVKEWSLRGKVIGTMCGKIVRAFCSAVAAFVLLSAPDVWAYDDAAITDMEGKLVSQFCQEREWLRCFYEQPSECERVVARFVRPCLEQVLSSESAQGDPQVAQRLTAATLACFNKRFEEDHRGGKKKTPECKNAPAHLQ